VTTLADLRQQVAQELNEYIGGYIDSATTTTIVDGELIDPIQPDTQYAGAWLWIATQSGIEIERHILRYTPSSGTITVSRPFVYSLTVNDWYEIHTLIKPSELNRLVNEAVEGLYYYGGTEIPISDPEDRIYSATFTDSPGHILSVKNRAAHTDDAEAEEYPVVWKAYVADSGSLAIEVEPSSITDSSGYLAIRYLKMNGELTSLNNLHVNEDYAVCAALCQVYEFLMRSGPALDVSRWERLLVYQQTRLAALHRKWGARGRVITVNPPEMVSWSSGS